MGLGGISIWQLLIILLIIITLFGTRRLKNLGGDIGQAIKSFRKSMQDEESQPTESKNLPSEAAEQKTMEKNNRTTPDTDTK